jgi:hypothetical protein
LAGCGISKSTLGLTQGITIAMTGTFEAPPDAAGNSDPRFEKITLNKVTLNKSDGTTVDASPTDPAEFKILSRPQIIAEKDLTDAVGTTFTSIDFEFAGTVLVTGRYSTDMEVALPNPTPSYSGSFTVEQQKSVRLDISLQWRDTVTRDDSAKQDSATAPAFSLDLTSG